MTIGKEDIQEELEAWFLKPSQGAVAVLPPSALAWSKRQGAHRAHVLKVNDASGNTWLNGE